MSGGNGQCPNCRSIDIRRDGEFQFKNPDNQVFPPENLTIKVYRTTPTAKLPTKAYEDDLGFDLYADAMYNRYDTQKITPFDVSWSIEGGKTTKISTGLHIELPKGYGAVIKPRSSQGIDNLDIYAGVVDGSYRGEWAVCVHNSNIDSEYVRPGEKIGQFILVKNPQATVVEVQSFGQLSATQRGQKGFGSSGK